MQEFARRAGLYGALGEVGGPQFVHIAGTNGKGSVTAFAQSLLVEQGYRTGAFFSPYVADPRERVQTGRDLITKEDFTRLVEELIPIGESMEETEFQGPTEFEFKAGLGFRHWQQQKCEWVALEVGLGGRLDATNIIDPAVSVIVSIGLDHTSILGDTEALIAREKAGIIKPDRPTVVGPMSSEAMAVIEEVARERGSEVWAFGRGFLAAPTASGWVGRTPNRELRGLKPGLGGPIQGVNLGIAIAALDAAGAIEDESALHLGASRAFLPGRLQRMVVDGVPIVLDGAHNSAAAVVLADSVRDGSYVLLTSMVQGHDPWTFYSPLRDVVSEAVVGPIDFHRAQPVGVLKEALERVGIPSETADSAKEALAKALKIGKPILVTGSFYWVGEILNLLQDR